MVGAIDFSSGPVPNVSSTPVVGGQWIKGEQFPFDLRITENQYAPEITVQQPFQALA